MRKGIVGAALALAAGALLAVGAGAASRRPRARRDWPVFVSEPRRSAPGPVTHRSEGRGPAVPAAATGDVTLTNLDGSGFLRGDYANIISETGNPAFSPTARSATPATRTSSSR